jgi:hypothetical protein
MYIVLFIVCIYAFVTRTSRERAISLYITIVVSIFGILGSALQTALENHRGPINGGLATAQVCSLVLTPLVWLAGINLFVGIATRKTPIQVLGGWFFTLVQISLIVVMAVFLNTLRSPASGPVHTHAQNVVNPTHISMISINWSFFLLFFSLVLLYGHHVSRKGIIILFVFGVVNTVRIIMETVFATVTRLSTEHTIVYLYLSFFLEDFLSAISLYVTTICWKNIQVLDNQDKYELYDEWM